MKKNTAKKEYAGKGKIALVNSITGARFIGAFLTIPIFKALGGVAAAIYSAIFMFSDCIDGFLARKMKASTFFGSMFDGVTDKTFIILTFLLLMAINPLVFIFPVLYELAIMMVQKKKMSKGMNVKSNFIGKVKTWVTSASMVVSLAAVELFDLKPLFEYLKTSSVSKLSDTKEILLLLGINLPGIIFQILTLNSYSNELLYEKKAEMVKENELEIGQKEIKKTPEERIEEIHQEKDELKKQYTLLEKTKILGKAMLDPEYYDKNKDQPIKELTRELFKKERR